MSEQTSGLKVFYAEGGEWAIATDPADAAKVYEEKIGEPYMRGKPDLWVALPDDAVVTIANDDGEPPEKKTCAEWAATGRGHLGSVNR